MPPSDYTSDDSFDDLPSPTGLLHENAPSATEIQKAKVKNTHEEDNEGDIFDKLWFSVRSPSPEFPEQHERDQTTANPMDTLYQSTRPISADTSNRVLELDSTMSIWELDTDADFVPVSSTNLTSASGQKRRHSSVDGDQESNEKRLKQYTPPTSNRGHEIALPELTASKQNSTSLHGTPAAVQKSWEDIDPALLDEFKDIVNFF